MSLSDSPEERGGEESGPLFSDDLARAAQVAAGDADAKDWFAAKYTERIYATVYSWCKPFCNRVECRLKRGRGTLLERIFGQDCDEVSEAYQWLLEQLEKRVLKGYEGRAPLDAYLFAVFSPRGAYYDRFRISFIHHYKGKLRPPMWAKGLSEADRNVLKELRKRADAHTICQRLLLEPDQLEASRDRLETAARRAGDSEHWGLLMSILGRDVPLPTQAAGDFGEEEEIDLPDVSHTPDRGLLLRQLMGIALAGLDARERVILRMRWEEDLKPGEVAESLHIETSQVSRTEAKALKRLAAAVSRGKSGQDSAARPSIGKQGG